jgi:ribosomal protein L34E
MLDSNDSDQEPSAAQRHENNRCPNCGDPLQAITRRGPTDATAQPCGCDISTRPLRDLDEVTA